MRASKKEAFVVPTSSLLCVRIVLVDTSHPGNIGAAARAMKTMGLVDLVLVRPKCFPHAEAVSMASGAYDLLSRARICVSIEEAIGDCQYVLATSARTRSLPWPLMSPDTAGEALLRHAHAGKVAVLFGNERTGLSNTQLALAHAHLHIPADEQYSSLNLAQAVQIVAYCVRRSWLAQEPDLSREAHSQLATAGEVEHFYQHLAITLKRIAFVQDERQPAIMHALRRVFQRSQLSKREVNILRGMLSAVADALPQER